MRLRRKSTTRSQKTSQNICEKCRRPLASMPSSFKKPTKYIMSTSLVIHFSPPYPNRRISSLKKENQPKVLQLRYGLITHIKSIIVKVDHNFLPLIEVVA